MKPLTFRTGWMNVKRLLCVLLLCLLAVGIAPTVLAKGSGFGFAPKVYKSGLTYGNGIYFAPYRFTVYSEPKEDAPVLGEFRWSRKTQSNQVEVFKSNGVHFTTPASRVFFCFYPELDIAMLAVTGDDDNGWLEVVYDQTNQKTGWVKMADETALKDPERPAHFGVYQTWLDFMRLNARANGIYWLSGVSQYQRSLRSKDEDTAKLIPVTVIRDLKVRHVRGNWLLVEVLDFERNMPIGWIRWRDEDGNLLAFPNLSGDRLPIVTTAY